MSAVMAMWAFFMSTSRQYPSSKMARSSRGMRWTGTPPSAASAYARPYGCPHLLNLRQ